MKEFPVLTNSRLEFKEINKDFNIHLQHLGKPHLDSFNHMLKDGLRNCVKYMNPVYIQSSSGERIEIKVDSIHIAPPAVPPDVIDVRTREIYPTECRQRHETYKGMCTISISWNANGLDKGSFEHELGEIPIMLKSKACNLNNLTPKQLIEHCEHEQEWGGYFIIKGNEKILRMLLMTRRNFPITIRRTTWKDRGNLFTDLGVLVRSVRDDEASYNNVLHLLNNGTAKFMFSQIKHLSYVPVCLILKCLMNYTDEMIFKRLIQGYEKDQYYVSCVQNMLRGIHEEGLHTHEECKNYLGDLFRSKFQELPPWKNNSEITDYILNERILIHLNSHEDKFNLIALMVQKLFQCAQDEYKIENVDSVMMQEVLLSGHLYQKFLADRIDMWLVYVKRTIERRLNTESIITESALKACLRQCAGVEKALQSFLATGNAPTRSGIGLMQNSGLCVMAENINRMRYMSHFRAIHRGSYFTEMRTTEARQLLPDAWGFICPVHTPDGTPCGLLNHLTVSCEISEYPEKQKVKIIPEILTKLGMFLINSSVMDSEMKTMVVMLEGKILGHVRIADSSRIVDKLRWYKIEEKIPKMTEIVYVPQKKRGQFPGIFLFVGPTRMMRPVRNLKFDKIEYIGSFEQVYMDIAVKEEETYPGITTHMELSKTHFLSNLANLIPMPDYNQSPRNMYQCQMGKQTMGTPCHNYQQQAQTKLYRLQTPATPLFRPVHHDNLLMDDFAMGTNAIVAVISYTGYDMEDAMIINKAAHERGFAYGSIYKTKVIELEKNSYFARDPHNPKLAKYLDNDGLPHPGTKIQHDSFLYCYFDTSQAIYNAVRNEEKECGFVDNVKYCGSHHSKAPKMATITLRIPRSPTIGDKFASRAGQKGICSQKYPSEDLPFTESGLIPDIVFNPHGFPSRMTIAMMIETMAGKSASIHGLVHDATPFQFNEKHTAIDYFGKLLEKGGYNYHGTEKMYSGVNGREMVADIFFGVVHYQRLRHMVYDKYQVRATGPIDVVTQQPIKGRKRGGGVRFGEMERDALISHGAAYLLQDRLFACSDKVQIIVCNNCGFILTPMKRVLKRSEEGFLSSTPATCRLCNDPGKVGYMEIPYAYKYLVTELSSLNINAKFILNSL